VPRADRACQDTRARDPSHEQRPPGGGFALPPTPPPFRLSTAAPLAVSWD
jgi:hypothetical protein